MKNLLKSCTVAFSFSLISNANATFSMIAIDTQTKEFGSALVTCINEDAFLSKNYREAVIDKYLNAYSPGKGIMNLQALPLLGSLRRAERLMNKNYNANDVIQKLIKFEKDDFSEEWNKRQYLALTMDVNTNQVYKSVFTGDIYNNYKVDNIETYAGGIISETSNGRFVFVIAGNHLTGESVINKMDTGFKETSGNLTEKIIGALQRVRNEKNIGDSRCVKNNTTSNFAFLKIYENEELLKYFSVYSIQSENKDAIDGLAAELN